MLNQCVASFKTYEMKTVGQLFVFLCVHDCAVFRAPYEKAPHTAGLFLQGFDLLGFTCSLGDLSPIIIRQPCSLQTY